MDLMGPIADGYSYALTTAPMLRILGVMNGGHRYGSKIETVKPTLSIFFRIPAMAEKISWCCALLMALVLVLGCCEVSESELAAVGHPRVFEDRPCDEIYVVREGETLHTISEKCGDPYIVEENPHIHDPDDVFPGLVIKITPFNDR
uniref:LysM domain-containing protein n=1 Tax=Salix viminalis TaxID=40686 RepID=A0A6N2LQ08_SALVM